jgi:hypothetical protein
VKTLKLFLVAVLFLPSVAFSKIILISDVDDTIKIAHVLDTWDSIENAFETTPFWRMPELYRTLGNPAVDIFYVSNAPRELMGGQHEKFLNKNNFPAGPLLMPYYDEREGHKLRQIRRIIEESNPHMVVMIGDNSEEDSEIYQQIKDEFEHTGIHFLTFIRVGYDYDYEGNPLIDGQTGFVTAGELALHFFFAGLIGGERAVNLVKKSLEVPERSWKDLLKGSKTLGLPRWVDCNKHHVDLTAYYWMSSSVSLLEKTIRQRCAD